MLKLKHMLFGSGCSPFVAALVAFGGLLTAGCSTPGAAPDGARLSALQVTGGGMLYPSFSPGVRHYAVRCDDATTLRVTARAQDADHSVTLLHNKLTATGSVEDSVTVTSDHDIAIEVGDGNSTVTYYVHCIPPDFPDITIEKRTDAVTDGLLLLTPQIIDPARIRAGMSPSVITFLAIVDNNGVPRWVRRSEFGARDFRRHADGRYSHSEWDAQGQGSVAILDASFNRIATARTVDDVTRTIGHEFLVTEEGNYLLLSYNPAQRDLSGYQCKDPGGTVSRDCTTMEQTLDSVIQEVTPDGVAEFTWNSWDHLNISDCGIYFDLPMNYAVINSMQLLNGDIVASFRGCNQVLRIARPSGAVVWQMGGTQPTRDSATEYLAVVGDPAGKEFCGQHTATATRAGSVLMFDNGYKCRGTAQGRPAVYAGGGIRYFFGHGSALRARIPTAGSIRLRDTCRRGDGIGQRSLAGGLGPWTGRQHPGDSGERSGYRRQRNLSHGDVQGWSGILYLPGLPRARE